MVADAGEHVHDFTLIGRGVVDAIGSNEWQLQGPRNSDRCLVAVFLRAVEVALQFDINISRAEQVHQPLDFAQGFVESAAREGCRQRAFVATGQADQTLGVFFDVGKSCSAFSLRALPQLVASDQAAEILISNGLTRRAPESAPAQPARDGAPTPADAPARPASRTAISAPMCARVPAFSAVM